jgi:hypothetical protein
MLLKTKSKELNEMWDTLNSIFNSSRGLTSKDIQELEKLGFRVHYSKRHPKLYFVHNGKTHIITMSKTPSDTNWGRQTLRVIRKIYEQEGE